MKAPWFALLCFGTAGFCGIAALCQSPTPKKIDPDRLFQMPDKFSQWTPDFETLKTLPPMNHDLILLKPMMPVPRPKLNDPQIDPKIILHPPWHNQSKGQDAESRLYPNLKFLPVHPLRPLR